MPIPWDMVVFVCITTVGFGFSIQKLVRRDFASPMRGISSVAEGAPNSDAALSRGNVIDLGCLESQRTSDTTASEQSMLRFKGRFCHLDARALRNSEGIRVRNLSNNVEGTIFFQGYDASFVTDAVALRAGKNVIQIEWKDASARWRTFTSEVIQK